MLKALTIHSALAAVAALTLTSCARDAAHGSGPKLALDAPLPREVPAETRLRIGDPKVQKQLQLSGLISRIPFQVDWQNVTGGPQTLEAFRASALDAGSVGDTPPIHAAFTGLDIKIVAVHLREKASMRLALAPGLDLEGLGRLRGKRIAYAPGQAQGALVLRVLERAHIPTSEVQLVELTSSEFKDALGSKQVDVAPLGGPVLRRYLKQYTAQGARAIPHGERDSLSFLYVRTAVLEDPAQAAALRAYVRLRAEAQLWASEHAERWMSAYYVQNQGLSEEDARAIIDVDQAPRFPSDWREAIALTQETVDLLAKAGGRKPFKAEQIFDLRFQELVVGLPAERAQRGVAAERAYAGAQRR
jgi:sulfonate transport system substrate-binding protein